MTHLEKTELNIGYIPLLDCIAILWAQHKGYFKDEGLDVSLVKEPSWASLRDRLAFGFLDAAHCLSTMVAAASISADQLGVPFKTPLALSHNRAYISLSQKLCYELNIEGNNSPEQTAKKVTQAIQQGQQIQFAQVFNHSIHHYILREWLNLADRDIASKIQFSTLPPPCMVEGIANQVVDGFCVGEPWNIQAEIEGFSCIIGHSQDIIPSQVPDKVLAVSAEWADQHPLSLKALNRAVIKAQQALAYTASDEEIWDLLIQNHIIRFNCDARIHARAYHKILTIVREINAQAISTALDFNWIFQKMKQWEHLQIDDESIDAQANQCIMEP